MIKLIYANGNDSDLFYAVKNRIPDNFFYFDINGKKHILLDKREIGAFNKHNRDKNITAHSLEEAISLADKKIICQDGLCNLALYLCDKFKIKHSEIFVPNSFPIDLIDCLRANGLKVKPLNPLYDRSQKNSTEINLVKKNLSGLYPAYDLIKKILKQSKIKNNLLEYHGEILTSEYLKKEVNYIFIEKNLIDLEGMIISSGHDASMPHHRGHGPIKANSPIICDFFPRSQTNGYFCDMTRTFIKGKPSQQLEKMYNAVLTAQTKAIKATKPGVKAIDIHNICVETFKSQGFDVGAKGFVHGTGHGLGIDIHETPYVNAKAQTILKTGEVFTVEPGLYYDKIGGVRIEDVVNVTKNGAQNLTNYPKDLKDFIV